MFGDEWYSHIDGTPAYRNLEALGALERAKPDKFDNAVNVEYENKIDLDDSRIRRPLQYINEQNLPIASSKIYLLPSNFLITANNYGSKPR